MKSEENLINNKMWLHNYIENIDSELDKINQVKKIFTDSIQTSTICGANGKQCAQVGKLRYYNFTNFQVIDRLVPSAYWRFRSVAKF